jgi:hypothetical protein
VWSEDEVCTLRQGLTAVCAQALPRSQACELLATNRYVFAAVLKQVIVSSYHQLYCIILLVCSLIVVSAPYGEACH